MLHLGDWQLPPAETDEIFAETSIDRIFVTLGNHEPWGEITRLLDRHPREAVRVSEVTWLLPRPARLTIGGRQVLSLGGAASVDRESRIEGLTWWTQEAITAFHVAAAIAGGPADLMLSHESPANTPVRPVREILRTNPHRSPRRRSRRRRHPERVSARFGTLCARSSSRMATCMLRRVGGPRTDAGLRVSGGMVRTGTSPSSTWPP